MLILSRSNDFSRRQKFVKLVEDVKKFGAEVVIFSSMHESGEREFFI
jgi:protein pelota